MNGYDYIQETLLKVNQGSKKDVNFNYNDLKRNRLIELRTHEPVEKIDKPSNLPRARSLGYKAKQGFVVVRVKIRKGAGLFERKNARRRPKRMAIHKITRRISIQRMAEQRAAAKYPNLEVLNSYFFAQDGKQKWFEVILIDPSHPVIKSDPNLQWIQDSSHKGRTFKGKTSAGQKNRGLGHGPKRSKNMPSLRANNRLGK